MPAVEGQGATRAIGGDLLGPGERTEARPRHPGAWLEWLMLIGYAAATAIAIGCALGIVVALTASAAMAAPAMATVPDVPGATLQRPGWRDGARLVDIATADSTGLLLDTSDGLVVAPVQTATAHMRVTGSAVRGTVTQRFTNPTDQSLEGVFVFPLPRDGAVDHVRMRVGDRTIEGRIEERTHARERYERAKAQGRQGSLVEQQRPDLFTTRIANIAPWSTVEVSIEYQQTLALRDGAWRLRFPALFTPRHGQGEAGQAQQLPVAATRPSVSMLVDIDAGLPISRPVSDSHEVLVIEERTDAASGSAGSAGEGARRYQVTLRPGHGQPERDFELEWQPQAGHVPAAALPLEKHGSEWYAMLMLTPPVALAGPVVPGPREVLFVVDTSRSMSGAALQQARAALRMALAQLRPGDRFNLVRSDARQPDGYQSFFEAPRPYDERTARRARVWASELEADGAGTAAAALAHALSAPLRDDIEQRVIFISDGRLDNEDELLQIVAERSQSRRLFTVGVGPASNSWLLGKAAEAGRGTFTRISQVAEVERRIDTLFAKLGRPLATGLEIAFEGAQPLDPLPARHELHAGEPLIVRARFSRKPSGATVSGWLGDRHWEGRASAHVTSATGLHVLWARDRIEALSDRLRFADGSRAEREILRDDIRALGLAHHLVTPFTSLVAIDQAPPARAVPAASGRTTPRAGWDHMASLAPDRLPRIVALSRELAVALGILLLAFLLLRVGAAHTRGAPAEEAPQGR